MEPNLDQPAPSTWNRVTPLSKYLAMALFIILPFVGGWIGYHYMPEKVVEVEKVVVQEKETTDNIKPAFATYIEGMATYGYSDRSLLGDSLLKTIYAYDPQTLVYKVLVPDVRNLKNFDQINIHHLSSLEIVGWSDDLRYLGIRTAAYEGIVDTPLYYLDTHNIDNGFHTVPNFRTSSAETVISPDGTKILGFEITSVSTTTIQEIKGPDTTYQVFEMNEHQLNMFDLNDLNALLYGRNAQGSIKIYGPLDDTLTFMQPNFMLGGHYINGGWIDENTIELKVSTVENYNMLRRGPTEENYRTFADALETVILKID